MNVNGLDRLVAQALEIEVTDAKEAGTLGYMARVLVQATLPHSDPKTNSFERANGVLSLAIVGNPQVGLPYGTYPRLVLSWLVTEAVRRKTPCLILGETLSQFMEELGLIPTGGRWGSIGRLRNQMRRLFSASVSCVYEDTALSRGLSFNVAREYCLWWDPKHPQQTDLWKSVVVLGTDFFGEIVDRPVPIDIRALKTLKNSSMALDLYCWLTYRLSYLRQSTEIPWLLLQRQFGSDYADTKQGRYEFKRKLLNQLKKVSVVYESAAKVRLGKQGLILMPGMPHIKK